MKKQIEIICEIGILKPWKTLKNYQGNLKDLSGINYEKLKTVIIEDGFAAPIFIWKNKNYILDGHQRIRVLEAMIRDGFVDPIKLPCVDVNCRDGKHAKRLILDFASTYGKATDEGFYQYLAESDLLDDFQDLKSTIDMPGIDMDKFEDGYLNEVAPIEKPDIVFTQELLEAHNYVVLYFDNEVDWLTACEVFGIKSEKALDSKPGYERIGTGRVKNGSMLLEKIT